MFLGLTYVIPIAIMGRCGVWHYSQANQPSTNRILLHGHWAGAMGWRGQLAQHEGEHCQAASHRQGCGEEEEDCEDEPHSGHPVHGLLAAIPCLLHSGILSTRYDVYVVKYFLVRAQCVRQRNVEAIVLGIFSLSSFSSLLFEALTFLPERRQQGRRNFAWVPK